MHARSIGRLVFAAALFVLAAPAVTARNPVTPREFAACQRALDRVAWRHWNWPAANPGSKPPIETLIPDAASRAAADNHLRMAAALDAIGRPIAPEDLQAELDRMGRESRDPARLAELFAALGDDPGMAAWCLAMPALAERRLRATWREDAAGEAQRTERPAPDEFERGWTSARAAPGEPALPPAALDRHQFRLPAAADATAAACDTWSTIPFVPEKRTDAAAAWTGSEMLVFGGRKVTNGVTVHLSDAVAYNPATNSWRLIGAYNGGERANATAAWNGTDVIVTGGVTQNSAGTPVFPTPFAIRVNPATNTLTSLGTPSGLSGLVGHASTLVNHSTYPNGAIYVFGGNTDPARGAAGRSNGLYVLNINTGVWSNPVYSNTPGAREYHTLVAIGSTVYAWGGISTAGTSFFNGFSYTVTQTAWITLSAVGTPSARYKHGAAVVNSKMMIWGGQGAGAPLATGAIYTPGTGWSAVTPTGAPAARIGHTMVVDSTDVYVWGGDTGGGALTRTGGRYLSGSDTWQATLTTGAAAAEARSGHVAIHTGTVMVVWSGQGAADQLQSGGEYVHTPVAVWTSTNGWRPESRLGAPAVWSGTQMWVFSGHNTLGKGASSQWILNDDGFSYTPSTGIFSPLPVTGAPTPRTYHDAVWTGIGMAVGFGKDNSAGGAPNGGGYLSGATWSAFPSDARVHPALDWSGTYVLWWGGCSGDESVCYNSGYRWNPSSGVRTLIGYPAGATGRENLGHAWNGIEWGLFGGCKANGVFIACAVFYSDVYLYNPATNSWRISNATGAPGAQADATAFWDGTGYEVWFGYNLSNTVISGKRLDPYNMIVWKNLQTAGYAGTEPIDAIRVYTGGDLLVFDNTAALATDHFETLAQTWRRTTPAGAPAFLARHYNPWVWTGSSLVAWSGEFDWGTATHYTGAVYSHDMPVITAEPVDQSVCVPAGTTFSAGATNLTSQRWYENGTALTDGARFSGTTSLTLSVLFTSPPSSNIYREAMAASNACGTANSRAALLDIKALPSPVALLNLAKSANLSLSWSAASGATSYNVRGCAALPCASPGYPNCINTGPTSCDADTADPERFYWIESVNGCGTTP